MCPLRRCGNHYGEDVQTAELLSQVQAWIDDDPDPITRGELTDLLAAAQAQDSTALERLGDAFAGFLEFGTAGLRGAIGGGPNRMNRAVVIRAAAGLAAWLTEHVGPDAAVVIGFDARHRSDDFARDTAAVMSGAGLHAMVLPHALPTPVLAFALRHLGAAAGVMVTASHNPPQDNGYKVYLGTPAGYNGSQIVPPVDSQIASKIAQVTSVKDVPMGEEWITLGDDVVAEYLQRTCDLVPASAPRELRIVHTPLHGVGGQVMLDVFNRAGFTDVHCVSEQFMPNPDFPTVTFPNPEEAGAIDLALELAMKVGADIVIANDPDADRCAAAAMQRNGQWRMLRGDEVGALLGWWMLRRAPLPADAVFANSIVSSSLLGKMAAAAGVQFAETLTGFKWLAREEHMVYAYEEALGYCVDPKTVLDKDGISAALLVAELAAFLKAQGKTVWDVLDDLAYEHGLHVTDQLSIRVSDLSLITNAMTALRNNPPATLAGLVVERVDDLRLGSNGLPPTDGLRFWLPGVRIIARPSGTEPKLKIYLEAVAPVSSDVDAAYAAAHTMLAALKDDLKPLIAG